MEPFQKTNRSAYLNFLRARYEMYTGKTLVESYPYYLGVDPSDLCQLRCPTCPTGIENEGKRAKAADKLIFRNKRSMLSVELFDALLEEMGEYLFLIMLYNYGEPLLNKNLPTFIRRAKAENIETEIHTNLSLPLSDEQIVDLLSGGIDSLWASIDGFSQETYQVHRVGGNVELVKNNLERLAKTRDRLGLRTLIGYNFLVFSFNEHEVAAAKSYCEDMGISFNARDAFVSDHDWLPTYRKNEEPWLVPPLARLRESGAVAWAPLPKIEESDSPSACGWHYGFSMVTAGGPVAPCCAVSKDEHDFGTVIPGRVRFRDVWNNSLVEKSRADFAGKEIRGLEKVETVCTHCPYPKPIQNLYSIHDIKVIAQFNNVFQGTEPVLEQAFDLFARTRYGLPTRELLQNGVNPPFEQIFVGHESKEGSLEFVSFFEQNLINEANANSIAKTRSFATEH